MAKESKYHIENNRILFYETFLDEQSVRKLNNGVPNGYVNFTQGVAHFTEDDAPSYGSINYGQHYTHPMDLTGDITVMMYIRPDNYGLGCADTCKILTNGEFTIGLYGGANEYVFATSDETDYVETATSSIVLDEWVNIIMTRTSAGVANFYLDGVLNGDSDQDSGVPDSPDDDLVVVHTDFPFIGDIDYITIYNRLLSVPEIENINCV